MSKKNLIISITVAALLLLILYFLFILDIGLNSERFVRRDFNDAFLARKTGNCSLFKEYIQRDHDKWGERCLEEKDQIKPSIQDFMIENLTINSNNAFVQVRLKRDSYRLKLEAIEEGVGPESLKQLEDGYLVTYDMQRTGKGRFLGILPETKWVITNEPR